LDFAAVAAFAVFLLDFAAFAFAAFLLDFVVFMCLGCFWASDLD
jgi:hypothetical protein